MKYKTNNNNEELNGLFIYHDPKSGCVFYDVFKKNGYVLSKSDYPSYNKFTLFKIISILSIYLLVEFLSVELWQACLFGIVFFIAIEIIQRKTFIYQLPVLEGYKPIKKDHLYKTLAKKLNMPNLIFTTILAAATTILVIYYSIDEGFEGMNRITTYLLALIMFAMFINGILGIISKIKDKH